MLGIDSHSRRVSAGFDQFCKEENTIKIFMASHSSPVTLLDWTGLDFEVGSSKTCSLVGLSLSHLWLYPQPCLRLTIPTVDPFPWAVSRKSVVPAKRSAVCSYSTVKNINPTTGTGANNKSGITASNSLSIQFKRLVPISDYIQIG